MDYHILHDRMGLMHHILGNILEILLAQLLSKQFVSVKNIDNNL